MSTTPINLTQDSDATASVTSFASRSISWLATNLPSGALFKAGALFPDAVPEERHDDESVITENPVESGSVTNDHAYDLPQELELTYAWSPSGSQNKSASVSFLNDTYQQLLDLKQAKIFLTVVTGKRTYDNMLIKSLSTTTDANTENILMIRIVLRQIILAITQTVTIPAASQQLLPWKTMPTKDAGVVSLRQGSNFNTKEALKQFLQGP